ncbi:MAG: amidohydrolase family protein [Pseudonocardiaceae bacterium]
MNVPVIPKIIDMEQKLREADEMGTDVSVLSHALPPDMVGAPQPTSGPCASTTTWPRIIDAYPGRFVGFASIGFGNPQRSIAEVDRCINELGFVGVQVFSNIANRVLDSAEFCPSCGISRHSGCQSICTLIRGRR